MAQSLCKIYIHLIFHIKSDSHCIRENDLSRIHEYLAKLVDLATNCKVLSVGGISNHIHILFTLSNIETVAHVVEEMKRKSSKWIKTIDAHYQKFSWQHGYAAFSVSQSQIDKTIHYIKNQHQHHQKLSFADEYKHFLEAYQIQYDQQYIFSD